MEDSNDREALHAMLNLTVPCFADLIDSSAGTPHHVSAALFVQQNSGKEEIVPAGNTHGAALYRCTPARVQADKRSYSTEVTLADA
jgi:hypothetical protein